MPLPRLTTAALLCFFCACGPAETSFPDRERGARAPLSAECDGIDPLRCGLPFPSNTFAVADASTATGLRLSISRRAIPVRELSEYFAHADGFSRVSPVITAFKGTVVPASATGSVALIVNQPGSPDDGQRVPVRLELAPSSSEQSGEETLIIAYPLRPLSANAEHIAIVLDSLETPDAEKPAADRMTRVALGLDAADGDEEKQRFAYSAPTREALRQADIDFNRVLRVWDFTTRSANDARARVDLLRTQAQAAVANVTVAVDSVVLAPASSVAAVVQGRLVGLPSFRDASGLLSLTPTGVHDAPFRVMIPAGTGNYRVVMYGHGTGGKLDDDLFDAQLGEHGLAKVSSLFYGWDETSVVGTFLALEKMQSGVARSSAGLMQAMADYSAIETSLNGVLGDALAAPMLGGVANPAAGRRPDSAEPLWTGGSLGGTLGLVYSGLSANVRYAVLNVPGAAWTHFVPESELYSLIRPALQGGYPSALDFRHALAMSQLLWDDVDGANYADNLSADNSVYLVQMSMGDSVLPNAGSEMVAASVRAVHLGKVLRPVEGAPTADVAINQSALTQFKVSGTSALDVHGFGSRNNAAGEAARDQISKFISSVLVGQPRIEVPAGCLLGSCDFSSPP